MVITISIISPVVVAWRRSPVVILVPVIVSVIISVAFSVISVTVAVMISMIASSPAATAPVTSQSEARPRRLAVMEIDSGCGSVGRLGDAKVNPDLEAGDLGPVHRLPGLLRILESLEVDKRESPGSLGWTIQHNLDLLQFAKSSKLSLQVSLCGGEVETKHSDTV